MDKERLVEVDLTEETVIAPDSKGCPNGCQRAKGSPTGG